MGSVPKCPVAGPANTNVMLEYWTSDAPSVPPLTQTCSIDAPFFSKAAAFPLPEMQLAVPLTTKRAVFVGLKVGQLLVSAGSDDTVAAVIKMWWVWAPRFAATPASLPTLETP